MGDVAQLGEHLLCKQGVASSNLVISTKHASCVAAAAATGGRTFPSEYLK